MVCDTSAIKRSDLTLRCRYIGLETEIYQIDKNHYAIYCKNYKGNFAKLCAEFNDSIRQMGAWVNLTQESPKDYLRIIEPISLSNVVDGFKGAYMTQPDIENAIIDRFPDVDIHRIYIKSGIGFSITIVDDLRKGVLKSLGAMEGYCWANGGKIADGPCCQNYGYVLETERYIYRLRCNPAPGDYQAYLSCFVNRKEKMGLTETGLRKVRVAADPDLPHSYDWYVMEDYNTPEERFTDGLSLEDVIRCYAASERAGKRLGVTKDGIAAVDLLIRHDGREWVSEDWTKSESFSKDPVAAGAVARLRRMLGEQNHQP